MTQIRTVRERKRGLSLTEVMASILILGTLITFTLTSVAGNMRQLHSAEIELNAARFARELFAEWSLAHEDLSVPSSGPSEHVPDWSWSRTAVIREVMPGFKVSEVTLTMVRGTDNGRTSPWRRDFRIWREATTTTERP